MGKPIETKSRFMVASGSGEKGMGNSCLMGVGFLWGMMKMFWYYLVVDSDTTF